MKLVGYRRKHDIFMRAQLILSVYIRFYLFFAQVIFSKFVWKPKTKTLDLLWELLQ